MRENKNPREDANPAVNPVTHAAKRLQAAVPEAVHKAKVAEIKAKYGVPVPADKRAEAVLDLRIALVMHLATIGPIHPLIAETKRPATPNGVKDATQDPKVIREWCIRFPNCNWGVTQNVVDVDSAVKPGNTQSGAETWNAIVVEHGEPDTYKVTTPSGGEHYYIAEELPNGANTLGQGIDSRGLGRGYVVAAGSHVTANKKERVAVTGFYTAQNHEPIKSAPWIKTLKSYKPAAPDRGDEVENAEPLIDCELLAECLGALDPANFRDQEKWFRLMCSCHHATAGQGYPEWSDWSLSDKGYNGNTDNIENRWNSLHVHDGGDLQMDSEGGLIECLKEVGRIDLIFKIDGDDGDDDEFASEPANDNEKTDDLGDEVPKQEEFPEPIGLGDLLNGKWPAIEYVLDGLIMKGVVNTFNADGGTGKTTVSTQVGVAAWAGQQIFGRKTGEPCPVLLVLGEDGEGITQARVDAQLSALFDPFGDLPIIRKDDGTWGAVKENFPPFRTWCLPGQDMGLAKISNEGVIKLLPFYNRLDAQMTTTGPGAFVVLDSLVDIVQMDMSLPAPANAFFKRLLTGLCQKHKATILVLAHPSKAAMADRSWSHGTLAMKNAVRNSIAMRKIDGQQYRLLWSLKHNYGGDDELRLYFEKPIFTLTKPSDSANPTVRREAAILEYIIELIRDGTVPVVMVNQGGGMKPRDIAKALNDSGAMKPECTWKDVQSVMMSARRNKVLRYIDGDKHVKAHFELFGEKAAEEPRASDFEEC